MLDSITDTGVYSYVENNMVNVLDWYVYSILWPKSQPECLGEEASKDPGTQQDGSCGWQQDKGRNNNTPTQFQEKYFIRILTSENKQDCFVCIKVTPELHL